MRYLKFAAALAATCASLLMADAAMAKPSDYYAGVGLQTLSGSDYTSAVVKGGAKISKEFGAEVELGYGLKDKEYYGYKIGVGLTYAAYATYTYPLGQDFDLIGRAGFGGWSLHSSSSIYGYNYTGSASSTGFAAGATVRKYFNGGKNGIRADVGYIASGGQVGIGYVRKL
jgi:hypothetical protein